MAGDRINKRTFLKKGLAGIGGIVLCKNGFCTSPVNPNYFSGEGNTKSLWKWSKEGYFYSPTPRGVKCLICPNECTIKENEAGDCRNRINFNGKLYSIAYGNPCAVHIDPIEKKPLYHFLPKSKAYSVATAGCNLACLNCQNWSISQANPENTRNYDLMPDKLIQEAIHHKCQSIAYTYSEPISFYEYTFDSAKIARENGIKNVLVTAGYINEEPLRNFCKYIDAANVDLKSFSDDIYMRLNAGLLEPILNTLKILDEEGVWLEITNLIVPGWTDDFDMIKKMCEWLVTNNLGNYPLHFSRFHPTYKLAQLPSTPVNVLKKAREIALEAGIKYVYIGNVPGSGAQDTVCPNCKKTAIERKGYMILQNNIMNNSCKSCNEKIPGVWE